MMVPVTVVLGTLLVEVAHAASVRGVIQLDIQKRQRPQDVTGPGKRASTYEEVITNERARGGYFATCRLGTPGQNLTLQLDTGSSDIWVPDSGARVCRQAATRGCDFGSCMVKAKLTSGLHSR